MHIASYYSANLANVILATNFQSGHMHVTYIDSNKTFNGCGATDWRIGSSSHFVYIAMSVLHRNPGSTRIPIVKHVRRKRVSLMGNTHP